MSEDFYGDNADLYGALVAPWVDATSEALAEILRAGRPGSHPILDVGSGIGTAIPTLANAGTGPLYAVEPSRWMRVGLMAVVAADPVLRKRTTVLPGVLEEVADRVPQPWGAIVTINALGHFGEAGRAAFWALAGERLAPGGQVVIGLQPPAEPVEIGWTDFGSSVVGDLTYSTSGRADPVGEWAVVWTMRWVVAGPDGEVLEERMGKARWDAVGPEDLAAAAATAGLRPGPSRPDQLLYSFLRD